MAWSRNCTIFKIPRTPEVSGHNPAEATLTTAATFQMNNAKLYVTVVILPINNNVKFLEYLMQGFRRTMSWNKYRSEIRTEPKNNNLDDCNRTRTHNYSVRKRLSIRLRTRWLWVRAPL